MGVNMNQYPGSDKDPLGLSGPARTVLDPLNIAPYYAGSQKKAAPPNAPDYTGAANQQTQANRPNVNTPFASQSWTQDANGNWTFNNSLSPQVQNAYANAPKVDFSKLPAVESGDAARQQAFDASYNQATSRLNPEFAQRDDQLRTQLANQGLDPNSQAGRAAMQQLANERTDAYSGARNSAIEQSREAGNDVFRNSEMARQMALAEQLRAHNLPMEDLQNEMGFMETPGFKNGGDLLGALQSLGNYNMNAYTTDQKKRAGAAGGLMSLLQLLG